ncbi:hypothetical protein PW52_12860 [Tamlana sedimentorum]|uniref:Uncharacterized protein n=1 Tax=Neotamlana sedimentorum TaxID=1435349 RepID=A0A0D7W775_9FLAO|nr:hypothetical protein [Tamlana sedimentorum]KJD34981.1 hypothetical protein PW52_12860 [Tamlana sedimentorum]
MKTISLILIFILNTITYSQNKNYVNDFGNPLTKTEFLKIKKEGGTVIRLKNNIYYKKGIIPVEYNGQISDSLKFEIIKFLESNANFKIKKTDKIIIDYAIDHKCNIINNINFNHYIKTIEEKKDISLFIIIDNYDDNAKDQIVDNSDLIKNNFFKYINWNLDNEYRCGGVLLIYPNNSFLRIYGEYNLMDIFERIK